MSTQLFTVGSLKQSMFRIVNKTVMKNYQTMAFKFLGLKKTSQKLPNIPVVKAL